MDRSIFSDYSLSIRVYSIWRFYREKKEKAIIMVVSRGKNRELLEWMEVFWGKKGRKEYNCEYLLVLVEK